MKFAPQMIRKCLLIICFVGGTTPKEDFESDVVSRNVHGGCTMTPAMLLMAALMSLYQVPDCWVLPSTAGKWGKSIQLVDTPRR